MTTEPSVPAQRGGNARRVLLVGAWFALVTGLLEVVVLLVKRYGFGRMLHVSDHFVWMAPVAYLALFALPALALAALAWRWPRHVTLPRTAGAFAFLGALGLIFMFPRLYRIAMLLLAAGAGVQASRIVGGHEAGFIRLCRSSLMGLVAVVMLNAAIVTGHGWLRERNALAGLPAVRAGAPNILLIILDTVRAEDVGLYGYARPTTPRLDALAAGGVVFDHAISTAPWTLPAHGAMFTGRYPYEQSSNWETPLDESYPTLAEVLAERGYMTAGFVSNTFYASREFGLDRGFAHYEDYRITPGEVLNSSSLGLLLFAGRAGLTTNVFRRLLDNYHFLGRKRADQVTDDMLRWVDGVDRPFFAFVNYFDAHWPYVSSAADQRRFNVTEPFEYEPAAYDAAIAGQDVQLGRLIDELDRRGLTNNTLVIITSDHGEYLGEHGRTGHGNGLYMETMHVPLVLRFPGHTPAGARIARWVSTRQLPATILALIGADDERRIPGQSLAALWDGTPTPITDPVLSGARRAIRMTEDLPIARGDVHSLIEDGIQYIRNGIESEELYDLNRDGEQRTNLVDSASAAPLLQRLRAELGALVPESGNATASMKRMPSGNPR
ncbi:MAG TPA: sulfatase [Gemmatimonadaceae bacterium]|nr:sulfatase [Gemmatimonadaceae bacterium]